MDVVQSKWQGDSQLIRPVRARLAGHHRGLYSIRVVIPLRIIYRHVVADLVNRWATTFGVPLNIQLHIPRTENTIIFRSSHGETARYQPLGGG
jgi:hypothetical protein